MLFVASTLQWLVAKSASGDYLMLYVDQVFIADTTMYRRCNFVCICFTHENLKMPKEIFIDDLTVQTANKVEKKVFIFSHGTILHMLLIFYDISLILT